MECHPVCDLFPAMTDEEFRDLAADIARRGQLMPIYTHDDLIVDGRHRYRACCMLSIAPRFEEWDGRGSLVEFVVALNLKRRHLTTAQRAALAVAVKQQLEAEGLARKAAGGRKNGHGEVVANLPQLPDEDQHEPWKARNEAARLVNVSPRSVQDAEYVMDHDPDAFEAVKRGDMSVHAAKKLVKEKELPPDNDDEPEPEPPARRHHALGESVYLSPGDPSNLLRWFDAAIADRRMSLPDVVRYRDALAAYVSRRN
jgi:hypothetical protein